MDVSSFVEPFLIFIVFAAAATVPVFLAVLVIHLVFGRWLAPGARQLLWSLVLVRLLLPVSLPSSLSLQPRAQRVLAVAFDWFEPAAQKPGDAVNADLIQAGAPMFAATYADPNSPVVTFPAAAPASQIPAWNWEYFLLNEVFPFVLIVGSGVMFLWTLITIVRLRRWVARGTVYQAADWLSLLAEGKKQFGIDWAVSLRTVPSLKSPATYGWWRPAILLPDDADTWSLAERRHVLWHELAHIRRHDVATNWGLAVVRVLHWWNPIFWYTQGAWLAERELACDALVLRRLEGTDMAEYGQTLLRFIERLSTGGTALSSIAPGFVLFLGRKQAVKYRLQQLTKLSQPEGRWQQRLGCAMLLALAITGLTDAYTEPQANARPTAPLELPAGITWSLVPLETVSTDEARTKVSYDLTSAVARIQQDDPELRDEIAEHSLRLIIQSILPPPPQTRSNQPQEILLESQQSYCKIKESLLIAHATAAQHDEIRRLLRRWSEIGMAQIAIRTKLFSTTLSLKELLPESGGTILNVGRANNEATLSGRAIGDLVWKESLTQAWTEHTVPVFTQVLTPEQEKSLVDKLQQNLRTNVVSSPTVTVFDGMSANIQTGSVRPFVTGFQSDPQGNNKPQISLVEEGVSLQFRPALSAEGKSVQLAAQYKLSKILQVETLEMISGCKPLNIQLPQLSHSVVSTLAEIPAGHSLLIVPLSRNQKGELHLCCLVHPLHIAE